MKQDNTRDLGWWHIPRWAPTTPRILISMIMIGLLGGISGAILYALAPTPWTLMDKMLLGLMIGFGVGIPLGLEGGRGGHEPKRVRAWRGISLRSILIAGLAYGFAAGLLMVLVAGLTSRFGLLFTDSGVAPKWVNWLAGSVVGILVGLPLGLRDLLGGLGERRDGLQEHKNRRNSLVAVLGAIIVVALASGAVLAGLVNVVVVIGIVVFLAVWLVVWLMPRIADKFVTNLAESQDSPQGPLGSWRNDRVFGLMAGLTFGLAGGLGSGLGIVLGNVLGPQEHHVPDLPGLFQAELMYGLAFGLMMGLVYGITASTTWATTLAWRLQLSRSYRIRTTGLMSFLEDARERDVLRTLGAFYQFRHSILQDQLAG